MHSEEKGDRAVDLIYASTTEPERWPEALQAIADMFDDVGTLLVYQRDDGAFGHVCSPGLEAITAEFASHYKGEDLRATRALRRGLYFHHNILVDRDLVSENEMNEHPFYRLLAKYGLRHHAAAIICPNRSLATSVAVQRSIHRTEYTTKELIAFEGICRHVENSLRISIRLFGAEVAREGYADVLEKLGVAVFALDHDGRVLFANKLAERLGDEFPVTSTRMFSASTPGGRMLRGFIGTAVASGEMCRGSRAEPVAWSSERTGLRYAAYILRQAAPQDPRNYFTSLKYLLAIRTFNPTDPLDAGIVRDVFKLTPGEAQLASFVGAGLNTSSAASRLGISEHTARTVLKSIFSKMGVSRQSEMAALMTQLILKG